VTEEQAKPDLAERFDLRPGREVSVLAERQQEQKLGTSTERRQELNWVEHSSRAKITGQERTREKEQREKSKRRAWSAENTDRTTNASRNDQGTLLR
jgi:hypothetical protein